MLLTLKGQIKVHNTVRPALLTLVILCILFSRFSAYIQSLSFDLAQHYFLVDEIMKHGNVRPPPIPNIATMAIYPPGAHWMAALIGWIGGSGLVGITLVTISGVFFAYLLIARLVGSGMPIAIFVFGVFFAVLIRSRSQIGWEIIENYFYPQLVADVIYFGTLLWLSRSTANFERAVFVVAAGLGTMWIQPLVALHIFSAGTALLVLEVIANRGIKGAGPKMAWMPLLIVIAASMTIVAIHPAFKVMKMISANNGGLNLGYSNLILVVLLCGAVGMLNCRKWLSNRLQYTDAVLGSAVIAAAGLALIQYAVWKLLNDGSLYAIKKHMFIIVTLGAMNGARLISAYVKLPQKRLPTALLSPIAAGLASFLILQSFTTPVRPILDAISYANNAVQFRLPEYRPGNTLVDTNTDFVDGLISFTSFEHPFDAQGIAWLERKSKAADLASFVMVKRSPQLDEICKDRFAESATYVIVRAACLKTP